jgi:hypothetical protein
MSLGNTKIVIGNRIYPVKTVDYEQNYGEYPEVTVRAVLNPFLACSGTRKDQPLSITNVIFNPPATIVFWSDNTKTVVKCDFKYEAYDPEKGIAMAISRKMLGDNKREYYNAFRHWLKKYNKQHKQLKKSIKEDDWSGDMYDAYNF